jgi:hypothetical protein
VRRRLYGPVQKLTVTFIGYQKGRQAIDAETGLLHRDLDHPL